MSQLLVNNPHAGYRFLPCSDPFSFGVAANPGYQIQTSRMLVDVPWREGLEYVRDHLERHGLSRHDLCAIQLRCPKPLSVGAFGDFNAQYFELLVDWGIIVDGQNPVARTNVAPVVDPPKQIVLHAVSYVTPSSSSGTFVISGGGELPHRSLERERIVRVGETSPDAMREKANCVVRIMQTRLKRLEVDPSQISRIAVYSAYNWGEFFESQIIAGLRIASQVGINWFHARPPVIDLDFEMDIHGIQKHDIIGIE